MTTRKLTKDEKRGLTAGVLKRGKDLASDRFPRPNPQVTTAWADALDAAFDSFPFQEMWDQAVSHWSVEMVTEKMATPRDIRAAVYAVREAWQRDPQRSAQLQQWRDSLYELNTGLPAAPRGELGA